MVRALCGPAGQLGDAGVRLEQLRITPCAENKTTAIRREPQGRRAKVQTYAAGARRTRRQIHAELAVRTDPAADAKKTGPKADRRQRLNRPCRRETPPLKT